MTNIIQYPTGTDRYEGREFVVGDVTKVWDGEKWVNKSQGNHEERIQENKEDIENHMNKSYNAHSARAIDWSEYGTTSEEIANGSSSGSGGGDFNGGYIIETNIESTFDGGSL